jgi:proteic killer suppression protein
VTDTILVDAAESGTLIRSFKNKITEAVFNGRCPKGFPVQIFQVARRKLEALDAAERLNDLRVPPANRLEALKKVGKEWRICFRWTNDGPTDVEIVDYH